jgi:hypothetical protein
MTTTHPPVTAVIITRDRVSYADQCLNALRGSAGIGDIHIVDHGSTYEPMLTWLGAQAGEVDLTRHDATGRLVLEKAFRQHVHWLPNQHPRDLWAPDNVLAKIIQPGLRFIVTDHDVVVPYGAPWVDTLHALLDERPDVVKAGLQLAIDDLPPELPTTSGVIEWEANYRPPRVTWKIPDTFGSPGWVEADVDTTVAMYRGLEPFALGPALRTVGRGVQARHLPWYENPIDWTEEQRWYAQRALHGHWRQPQGFEDTHGLVTP